MVVEEWSQLAIVGAEVMPPLADAMRLIDGDQREFDTIDEPPESVERRPLRRDIEDIEVAVAKALDGPVTIAVRAGQRRRMDANCLGASDLVVHQRDQRRDD